MQSEHQVMPGQKPRQSCARGRYAGTKALSASSMAKTEDFEIIAAMANMGGHPKMDRMAHGEELSLG